MSGGGNMWAGQEDICCGETEVRKQTLVKILSQYSKHCNLELDDFTGEFYQTFKELIYTLLKHFQKIK